MHTDREKHAGLQKFMIILSTFLIFWSYKPDVHAQDWQPVSTLVSTSSKIEYPVIKAFDENIHLIWEDYRDNGKSQVYYKHSTDKGINWIPGMRLSVDPNESYDHDMAVWNTNVHVVWSDARHYSTDGSVEIYYKRSTNNGDSFDGDVRLTTTADQNRFSDIAVFENTVHLIWVNYGTGVNVNYIRSEDNGNTWSIPLLLSNPANDNSYPQIGVFGNNVFVVWHKWNASYTNNEISYRRSRDNGNNWDPETTLINGGGQFLFYPLISMFNDNIHITSGRETTDPQGYLYYYHSTNCGDDWLPETQLTFDDVPISGAPVSVFTESVHLVWSEDEDGDGTYEISYMASLNNGVTWEPEFQLSDQANDSDCPSIAVHNEDIYVVWEEFPNMDIRFRHGSLPPAAVERPLALPGKFQLFQNYPNPFNPSTTLTYYLPRRAEVTLTIFDSNGKEVKRYREGLSNPGIHMVQWTDPTVSSGIYFYRIDARTGETGFSDIGKMTLVK